MEYVEEQVKEDNCDNHFGLTACITIVQYDEFNIKAGRSCIRGLVLFQNELFSFIFICGYLLYLSYIYI